MMLIPNTQQYFPKNNTDLSDMANFLSLNVLLFGLAAVLSVQLGLSALFFHQMVWYSLVATD